MIYIYILYSKFNIWHILQSVLLIFYETWIYIIISSNIFLFYFKSYTELFLFQWLESSAGILLQFFVIPYTYIILYDTWGDTASFPFRLEIYFNLSFSFSLSVPLFLSRQRDVKKLCSIDPNPSYYPSGTNLIQVFEHILHNLFARYCPDSDSVKISNIIIIHIYILYSRSNKLI